MSSRSIRLLRGVAVATAVALIAGPVAAKTFKQLGIGTNPQGSAYYAAGSFLSKVLADKMPLPVRVQPFAGSNLVLSLVDSGELALGLASGIEADLGYRAKKPFLPAPRVRVIAVMFPLMGSMIVRNNSDIRTIADLRGKRVAGDFKAQLVVRILSTAALAADNISWSDVKMVPAPNIINGSQGLVERRIDSIYFAVGPAKLRELDAIIPGGIRFLPINAAPAAQARMVSEMPGGYTIPVKKGMSAGIREDVALQVFDNYLVAATHLDNDLAYKLTKQLHADEAAIKKTFPVLRGFSRAKMVKANVTVPYHEGAIRAYKELGLWSARLDAVQAALLKR